MTPPPVELNDKEIELVEAAMAFALKKNRTEDSPDRCKWEFEEFTLLVDYRARWGCFGDPRFFGAHVYFHLKHQRGVLGVLRHEEGKYEVTSSDLSVSETLSPEFFLNRDANLS